MVAKIKSKGLKLSFTLEFIKNRIDKVKQMISNGNLNCENALVKNSELKKRKNKRASFSFHKFKYMLGPFI
ncbi:hypothetical protein VVYB158_10705 [Vibrio vulnificus CladeA-yb158]|nr:hypothetical protein VVYB158_10705 [Vibrio vulnificus CladeA-yb158]